MSELQFDRARLNTSQRLLFVDSHAVDIQPLVFDLLCYFARHPRRAVPKPELLSAVWRSRYVSDSVVARAVMKARRAILDDATSPRLLRTVSRVGYCLDAEVVEMQEPAGEAAFEPFIHSRQGVMALLPFVDGTQDRSLSWCEQGLMGLLHHVIERSNTMALLPVREVNLVWASVLPDGDRLEQVCSRLGVAEALHCEIRRDDDAVTLRALRGASLAQAKEYLFSGVDPVQLTLQLADELAVTSVVRADAHPDLFWHEQFARAMGLHQSGQFDQALALLEACRPHLAVSMQFRLLHARVLLECNQLDAACEQIEIALRNDDAVASPVRVQLLILWGQCDFAADKLPQARAHYEEALTLTRTVPGTQALRPEIMSYASNVAARQADPTAALRLAEAAVAEAEKLGQLNVLARSCLHLAIILDLMGLFLRAEPVVQHAVELARRTGVIDHEARALRLLANVQNNRGHYKDTLDSARRSIALWIRCGNVASRLWARLMELLILIQLHRLDEALQAAEDLRAQAGMQRAHLSMLQMLAAMLDWRLGRIEPSITALQNLAEASDGGTNWTHTANAELVFMYARLGRFDRGQAALTRVDGTPIPGMFERRRAALVLAQGQRKQALEMLRALWQSVPLRGIEAVCITLDLAWMLLEDVAPHAETPELESLFAHVVALSAEEPAVDIVRSAYLLRLAPSAHTVAQWDRVVAAAGLVNEHFSFLATPAYREALASGSPPKLRELITRVCW